VEVDWCELWHARRKSAGLPEEVERQRDARIRIPCQRTNRSTPAAAAFFSMKPPAKGIAAPSQSNHLRAALQTNRELFSIFRTPPT